MGQVAGGMRIHGCRRMTWEEHTSYDIAPLPIMGKHGFINVLESNPTRSTFLLGSLRLTCHKVPASPHLKWLLETFLPATITYHVSQRLILALGPSSHFLPWSARSCVIWPFPSNPTWTLSLLPSHTLLQPHGHLFSLQSLLLILSSIWSLLFLCLFAILSSVWYFFWSFRSLLKPEVLSLTLFSDDAPLLPTIPSTSFIFFKALTANWKKSCLFYSLVYLLIVSPLDCKFQESWNQVFLVRCCVPST